MRALLKNLVALFVGVLLAAVVLEVGVRLLNPFELRVKGREIILRTNVEWRYTAPRKSLLDSEIVHRKNNIGFRGADYDASSGALRVFAVGGSTTECTFLSDGKTWTDRLAEKLGFTFPRLWLNNAGFDGHTTFGHRILLDDHIARYRPALLIFLVGINDVGVDDLTRHDRQWLAEFWSRSAAANLVVNLYGARMAKQRGIGHDTNGLEEDWLVSWEINQETKDAHVSQAESVKDGYRQRLLGLVRASREIGSEVVLVTQPVLYGPGVDDRTGLDLGRVEASNVDGETAWMMLESYNDVTRSVAGTEGVHLIDLARTLRKSSYYFYDTMHFTNQGAERVGQILHESLCPYMRERFPGEAVGTCKL